MTAERLKIVILSNSDTLGGAAIASFRLMQQLRRDGHKVTMIVKRRFSDDRDVVVAGTKLSRSWAFLRERLEIFMHNGFTRRDLFKVSTGGAGVAVYDMPQVREADVVIVGWVCQGLLSLKGLGKIASMPGKRIAVVMHDLWWMTGICHHPYGCRRFEGGCGECKFLHRSHPSSADLSHKIWAEKESLYQRLGQPVRFIAVSRWVKEMAQRSSLLKNREITVVHNPMNFDSFKTEPDRLPALLEKYRGKKVISLGAARLDDPVKGIDYAIDALNLIADNHSELAEKSVALFFGAKRDAALFQRLRFPHVDAGMITDPGELRRLLSSTDVILSSSLYETYGGTLLEGIASGATAVTYGEGGQRDIVIDDVNGFIAEPSAADCRADRRAMAVESLAGAIVKALERTPDNSEARRRLRQANRDSIRGLCDEPFVMP